MIEDIFSRKIVGWEVHAEELAEHASTLISKACLAEGGRSQSHCLLRRSLYL
jgi:putative transposase